jgi:DNA-binding ferritin-like protein
MKLRAQIEEAIYESKIALSQAKKNNDEKTADIYQGYIEALTWVLESREIKDKPADLPYYIEK